MLPTAGMINMCVDGSYNPRIRNMGYDDLIRNSQGCWVARFHGSQAGRNPLFAEALALFYGLQFSWDTGYRTVACNLDCKELVQALGDEESCYFMPILDDFREVLHRQ